MSPEREAERERRHPYFVAGNLLDRGCAHHDGWFDLLDRTLTAIEVSQPGGVALVQVKQKLGKLRIYADDCNAASAAAIAAAEAESATVCEVCGSPGTLRADQRFATRCGRHRDRRAGV